MSDQRFHSWLTDASTMTDIFGFVGNFVERSQGHVEDTDET